jgi:putative hemolysin
MTSLGRIPQAADRFEWNTLNFEVMDMDGNRVDKVLVSTLANRTAPPPEAEEKK